MSRPISSDLFIRLMRRIAVPRQQQDNQNNKRWSTSLIENNNQQEDDLPLPFQSPHSKLLTNKLGIPKEKAFVPTMFLSFVNDHRFSIVSRRSSEPTDAAVVRCRSDGDITLALIDHFPSVFGVTFPSTKFLIHIEIAAGIETLSRRCRRTCGGRSCARH